MKFIDLFESDNIELTESTTSDKFAIEIDKAITKIDDEMDIKDFAKGVATILQDNYGSHNYQEFFKIVKQNIE